MKKILVTGCAGFIGSHLCEKLVNENYNVIGLDNLSNGKISNLKSLKKENKFHFIDYELVNRFNIANPRAELKVFTW